MLLLGSQYELSDAHARAVTKQMLESYANLAGKPTPPDTVEPQMIVIEEASMWGDTAAALKRSVMVPMLDKSK